MARPQKYSDSEIAQAIQSLVAEGEVINPMRVRMRLGGGNITRIKAILEDRGSGSRSAVILAGTIPQSLSQDFQRLAGEASQQMLAFANKCWIAASNEATVGLRDEIAKLRKHAEALEVDLAASTELVVQIEAERDEKSRAIDTYLAEKREAARQSEELKAALRNAESDLRAAQKMIQNFERNQQLDREEIRQLHKRTEDLVAELATLRRGPSAGVGQAKGSRKSPP